MLEWIALAAVIGVNITALLQLGRDPSISPEERKRSYWVLLFFACYLALGVLLMLLLPLERLTVRAFAPLLLGVFSWAAFGVLWILRTTPSRRPPPAYFLKPWTALDFSLIAAFILSCILTTAQI